MVVAFYFRLHLAYFPRPVVAIFARPEHSSLLCRRTDACIIKDLLINKQILSIERSLD